MGCSKLVQPYISNIHKCDEYYAYYITFVLSTLWLMVQLII